jgi:hypothetical protein
MIVIIDNNSDMMSSSACSASVEGFEYTSEQNKLLLRDGHPGGNNTWNAMHGLSLLLIAKQEGVSHTLLVRCGGRPGVMQKECSEISS